MFKQLVENSNEGFKTVHAEHVSDYTKEHGADIDKNIYAFINQEDMDLFENGRQCEDMYGNNILHFIFFLPDMPGFKEKYHYLLEKDTSHLDVKTKIRNIFLDIAIEEDLGDLRSINQDNYLPYQIEHLQPIRDIPEHLQMYFKASLIEWHESDYLIVTERRNEGIIKQQLRPLKLLNSTSIFYVKQRKGMYDRVMYQLGNM